MPKLTQKIDSGAHRVIVYGAPETGKTTLVGELAEKYNLHFLDLDNGYRAMAKLPIEWQERINLISLPDTASFPIAIETIMKVTKGKTEICWKHGKVACPLCRKDAPEEFDTLNVFDFGPEDILVLDSATQLASSAGNFVTKGKPDDYKYTYDDWRKQGALVDRVMSAFQQAPYNVVVVSHEVEATMQNGKHKIVPVGGTGNFSRNMAKYFDHVIYAEVRAKKHTFVSTTTAISNTVSGSRTDFDIEKLSKASLLPIFDN